MEINLNFLKFHYFKYDNKTHNLCVKWFKKYLENIFYNSNHSLLFILLKIQEYQGDNINDFKNILRRFHHIKDDHRDVLINNIIKKRHNNLYQQIEQFFSYTNLKNINFYQCKIDKQERLIFTIHNGFNNKKIFIPLIFDLNHVVYKDENKNYDNKNLIDCYKWDLKNEQEMIKNKIKDILRGK